MNKKGIYKQAAEQSGIPEEVICASMDAVENVIKSALIDGHQIHWGDFFRAWMVERRPVHHQTGSFLRKDTSREKIRFMIPVCEFASGFARPIKRVQYNIENPGWKKEWYICVKEALKTQEKKQKAIEVTEKMGDGYVSVQQETVIQTNSP